MKMKDDTDLGGEELEKQLQVCGIDFAFCDRRALSVRWVGAAQQLKLCVSPSGMAQGQDK